MNKSSIAAIIKSFDKPDDVTRFSKGKFEKVTLGGMTIGRATYEPGWKWSVDVGPGVGEQYCTVEHVGMVVSGVATAAFADGETTELKAGDLFYVPSDPHDSWVVGDEPYVSLHFLGATSYAQPEAVGK
ncbi:MAG: cupin domain-containing protein [Woeseiaceae bacterium]|nr:cupin domain-containing protein [Woeseiaceae bacterium]